VKSAAGNNAMLSRRHWLAWGCAHCAAAAGLAAAPAVAQTFSPDDWQMPERFARPDVATDEGGMWAAIDREETKLRRSHFVMRDAGLRDYLQAMVARLAGPHIEDIRVYPMRVPYFNASMYPNGMMQVWSGLLLRAENEAQLASVVGHEIAHFVQRHSIARWRDMKSRAAAMTLVGWAGVPGLLGQMALIAGMGMYSRDHEREADAVGLTLMLRAGYDPAQAAQMWAHMRAELAAGKAGDASQRNALFASHPPSDERQATLETLAVGRAGDKGEQRYQQAIAGILGDLVEDELKRAQYDESIVLFTRLSKARPLAGELMHARGEAYRLRAKDGDVPLAEADFRAALAVPKPLPAAHRSLAFMHRERGDKAAAAESFKQYLQAAPSAPDAGLIQSFISELQT
jgi:beta-barrel assembly-enhancing protease